MLQRDVSQLRIGSAANGAARAANPTRPRGEPSTLEESSVMDSVGSLLRLLGETESPIRTRPLTSQAPVYTRATIDCFPTSPASPKAVSELIKTKWKLDESTQSACKSHPIYCARPESE